MKLELIDKTAIVSSIYNGNRQRNLERLDHWINAMSSVTGDTEIWRHLAHKNNREYLRKILNGDWLHVGTVSATLPALKKLS